MIDSSATKIYRAHAWFLPVSLLYFAVPAIVQIIALSHLIMDTPFLVTDRATHNLRPATLSEMTLFIGVPIVFEIFAIRLFLLWKNARVEVSDAGIRVFGRRRRVKFAANWRELAAISAGDDMLGENLRLRAGEKEVLLHHVYRDFAQLSEEVRNYKSSG